MAEKKQKTAKTGVSNKCTDKELIFISKYLENHNATQAYQETYGSSYSTAMTSGCKLLKRKRVADEVAKRRKELYESLDLSLEAIYAEWAKIAFADAHNLVESDGNRLRIKDSAYSSAISEITINTNGSVKLRMHDKAKALEHLMELAGADTDNAERNIIVLPEVDNG